jgi:hypothetical protein
MDTLTITVNEMAQSNRPPVANAGPDQTISLPVYSITLDGSSSSDPDNNIVNYSWRKISGPVSFTIANDTAVKTQVTNLTEGIYEFELKVTDSAGLSDRDTVTITVNDMMQPNRPPVADAGSDQTITLPTNSVTLDGSASTDPDNNIKSYLWTKISGPSSFNIIHANAVNTQVTYLTEGTYKFELKVIDAGGLFDKDTVGIEVRNIGCYNSNCNGYWICLSNYPFQNVLYTAPGYVFPGTFGAATTNGSKMFFGGGHEEGYIGLTVSTVNIYNTLNNSWSQAFIADRSHLSAASCGNKVLFAGGNNKITDFPNPPYGEPPLEYYTTVDIFDADNYAHTLADISEPRSNMASVSTTDKAFFIGGKTLNGYSSKMDIYDHNLNLWTVVNLPRERTDAGAVIAGNKIFIAGGKNSSGNLTTADVYDLADGSWSTLEIPHEHPVAAMAFVNNKIIIAGGDGLTNKSVDIYDISSSTWHSEELSDSRYDIAVTVANNKVIFLGGNFSCNVDIYNAITDSWSLTHLSDGVTGVAGTSTGNKCGFIGFLYQQGYALTNTAIIIEP